MNAVGDYGVSEFLVGRDLQAGHRFGRRTDGIEIHLACSEVEAGYSKSFVVDNGVGGVEDRDALAGLADQIQVAAEADSLHAGKIGLSEIDAIDQFEVGGAEDVDLEPNW